MALDFRQYSLRAFGRVAIAVEFYQPSPKFWGVASPPDDWNVATSKKKKCWLLRNDMLPIQRFKIGEFLHVGGRHVLKARLPISHSQQASQMIIGERIREI